MSNSATGVPLSIPRAENKQNVPERTTRLSEHGNTKLEHTIKKLEIENMKSNI